MNTHNKQEELERILRFNCPCGCDGNGSYPEQTADDEWEQGQCQWCFEYGVPAREAVKNLINSEVNTVLERLKEMLDLDWYLRNEGNESANAQETGEANIARFAMDIIIDLQQEYKEK